MTNKKTRWDFRTIMTAVIITLSILSPLYPLTNLFLNDFKDTKTGVWTTDNYVRFSSKKYYKSALLNSFKLTFCITVIAIVLGVPLIYFISFYKIKGKRMLEIPLTISMMSPSLIGAYSWTLLLGRSGIVTQFLKNLGIHMPSIYGFGGVLLVFALKLYLFVYMYVSGALKRIDVALSEVVESLGCGGFEKVFTVIIPLVAPTLIAAALLAFTNCMANFGTSVLISERCRVMSTLVYSEFMGETEGSANFIACMVIIMVVVIATVFLLQKWYVNIKSFTMSSMRPTRLKGVHDIKGFFIYLLTHLLAATSIAPQCMVVYASFRATKMQAFADGSSPGSYREVLSTTVQSIKNTYLYRLAAIVITMVPGMPIAYLAVRHKSRLTDMIDTIAMFLYIVPGSIFGITLLIAFNHPPMMPAGFAIVMIVSLIIRRQTRTLCSSPAILYQISPSMKKATISLGDLPSMPFVKMTVKMMLPGVASGAILGWIALTNELNFSVVLYTANIRIISVAICNEVTQASCGTAVTLAAILAVTTVVSLLIFFKVSDNRDVVM